MRRACIRRAGLVTEHRAVALLILTTVRRQGDLDRDPRDDAPAQTGQTG